MQVRLQNKSGRRVTNGEVVRIYPGTTDGFIVAKLTEFGIIGTVSGTILAGQFGMIDLVNTIKWSDVIGVPVEFPPEDHRHPYSEIDDHPEFYTKEELATPGSAVVDWENIVNEPINVSALFLDDSASDISTYHKLLPSPSATAEVEDSAQSNNGAEVLIEAYVMDSAFGALMLSGGAWHFVIFGKVDSVVGVSTIVTRVYKRTSGGVETELFFLETDALSTEITEHSIESVQPDFMVDETDRLVMKFFAKSTSVPLRTIYLYHNGIVNYSHVHTTFSITFNTGSLALGETAVTAYRGDRGKTAYDHSQTAHLAFEGLAKITVGAVAPISPAVNDIWIDIS